MKTLFFLLMISVFTQAQCFPINPSESDFPKDPPGLEVLWRTPNNTFQKVYYKGKYFYREILFKVKPDGSLEWYWSKKYDGEKE